MLYISNAFSLSMVKAPCLVRVGTLTAREVAWNLRCSCDGDPNDRFTSVVGHLNTAAVYSSVLGLPIEVDKRSITLKQGDELIVGQYTGPRLPEGATVLPEGAPINWLVVTITD
jgi:Domain of unknown function (DUF1874)